MPLYLRQKEFIMKKIISLMLILALSLTLIVFSVSCKSCNNDDNTGNLPGGVENPGDNLGGGDGDDNNDSNGDGMQGEWLPIG